MPYRDERDSLYARNAALESELSQLRAEQERTQRELERLRSGEPESDDFETELSSPGARVHKNSALAMVAMALLVFMGVQTLKAMRAAEARSVRYELIEVRGERTFAPAAGEQQ